jgi:hypothetical protein
MRNKMTRWALTTAGVLVVGIALSACGSSSPSSSNTTTTAAPGTTTTTASASSLSQVQALSSAASQGQSATFAATWTSTSNGTASSLTLAQSPPKSLFAANGEKIISTGTTTYICGSSGSCVSEAGANPLASIEGLYDGSTFRDTVEAWSSQSVLQAEGVTLTFTTGTYGGVASKCVNISKSGSNAGVWCVGNNSGILTYWAYGSSSFTLQSYSSSPPSSDFTVPAGDTITTIP